MNTLRFAIGLCAVLFAISAQAAKPTNILIIVSDDQGYQDLGCFGSDEIKTPHLDKLAAGGAKLTNFYVTWPACTPSRGSLLTGRYPQRNGTYDMYRNEAPDYDYLYKPGEYEVTFERVGGMDTREVLLPAILKQKGFTSGIYGKWDLGIHKRFLPIARGFDEFYGFVNTGIDYYTHERYGVHSMFRNNKRTEEDKGIYATTLFHREAKEFLDKHHNKPFFLYVPFNAPHNSSSLNRTIRGSIQAPEEYKALYPAPPEPQFVKRTIKGKEVMVPTSGTRRRDYLASVTCMDDAIGGLLNQLEEYGIADNTLVIFFSDNGGGGGAINTPLRGKKAMMFEGGIRVPCIVRWPGKIPAGTTSHEFLTSLEVLPTAVAAAGAKLPQHIVYDGFDMTPILQKKKASPRKEMFWQRRFDKAARVENWKWVESAKGSGLFDLSKDISEKNDLSKSHPKKLKELKAAFAQWTQRMEEAEPRGPFRDY